MGRTPTANAPRKRASIIIWSSRLTRRNCKQCWNCWADCRVPQNEAGEFKRTTIAFCPSCLPRRINKTARDSYVALLDHYVTPDQNYVNDFAAGGSYERKCD